MPPAVWFLACRLKLKRQRDDKVHMVQASLSAASVVLHVLLWLGAGSKITD